MLRSLCQMFLLKIPEENRIDQMIQFLYTARITNAMWIEYTDLTFNCRLWYQNQTKETLMHCKSTTPKSACDDRLPVLITKMTWFLGRRKIRTWDVRSLHLLSIRLNCLVCVQQKQRSDCAEFHLRFSFPMAMQINCQMFEFRWQTAVVWGQSHLPLMAQHLLNTPV